MLTFPGWQLAAYFLFFPFDIRLSDSFFHFPFGAEICGKGNIAVLYVKLLADVAAVGFEGDNQDLILARYGQYIAFLTLLKLFPGIRLGSYYFFLVHVVVLPMSENPIYPLNFKLSPSSFALHLYVLPFSGS